MTSPPPPPFPPLGPPRGTNFSRRKLTQPRPPSPAITRILTSSMNFMRNYSVRDRSHNTPLFSPSCHMSRVLLVAGFVLFRRAKKKPRRGAFVKQRLVLLSWQDSDALP